MAEEEEEISVSFTEEDREFLEMLRRTKLASDDGKNATSRELPHPLHPRVILSLMLSQTKVLLIHMHLLLYLPQEHLNG